mmetsp:Transcript_40394/g.121689  ORF Transcript_40394/g.121689 Transcript_40394/m.121689 type:complete len:298 (-) Transcript_40394:130-1023(-)
MSPEMQCAPHRAPSSQSHSMPHSFHRQPYPGSFPDRLSPLDSRMHQKGEKQDEKRDGCCLPGYVSSVRHRNHSLAFVAAISQQTRHSPRTLCDPCHWIRQGVSNHKPSASIQMMNFRFCLAPAWLHPQKPHSGREMPPPPDRTSLPPSTLTRCRLPTFCLDPRLETKAKSPKRRLPQMIDQCRRWDERRTALHGNGTQHRCRRGTNLVPFPALPPPSRGRTRETTIPSSGDSNALCRGDTCPSTLRRGRKIERARRRATVMQSCRPRSSQRHRRHPRHTARDQIRWTQSPRLQPSLR